MGKGCFVLLLVSFVAVCANIFICCFALLFCFVVSFVDLLIYVLMC